MSRPLVGVTTSVARGYFMWRCIQLGLWLAGAKAKRLTADDYDAYADCKAFVISGGVDIDPGLYGQANTSSHHVEPPRDLMEQTVIQHALDASKPLMGICRGAQMINIMLGGDLYQEVQEVYTDFLPTSSFIGKTFGRSAVNILHDGIIKSIFKAKTLSVNSIHHQAIATLGQGLVVSVNDRHGIPQAIECKAGHQILGMQWHPELMLYQRKQRQIFQWLVNQIKP